MSTATHATTITDRLKALTAEDRELETKRADLAAERNALIRAYKERGLGDYRALARILGIGEPRANQLYNRV